MLDTVRRACEALGDSVDSVEVREGPGSSTKALLVSRGAFRLIVIDRGSFAQLSYILELSPDEAALVGRLSGPRRATLDRAIEGAIQDGRTMGYVVVGEVEEGRPLLKVIIEQRLLIRSESEATVQRIADGVQEVIVVGRRVARILGAVVEGDARPPRGPNRNAGDAMFA